MIKKYRVLVLIFLCPFSFLHILIYMLLNSNEAILKDIKIWKEFKKLTYNNIYVLLSNLLIENKDFRNLFYYRVKRFLKYENHKKIVKILVFVLFVPAIMLLREMPTLIIGGEIGGGLLLVHCFCTVISPEKMAVCFT